MSIRKDIPQIIIKHGKLLDPIFIFYCQNNPELKSRGWNDWVPPSEDVLLKRIENYKKDIVEPKILKYSSNQAIFATIIANASILFLSDAYDDDWKVYIDGKQSKILRASYAFRAVAVPQGEHIINFKYQPKSFVMGAFVSLSSILFLIALSIYFVKKKQF